VLCPPLQFFNLFSFSLPQFLCDQKLTKSLRQLSKYQPLSRLFILSIQLSPHFIFPFLPCLDQFCVKKEECVLLPCPSFKTLQMALDSAHSKTALSGRGQRSLCSRLPALPSYSSSFPFSKAFTVLLSVSFTMFYLCFLAQWTCLCFDLPQAPHSSSLLALSVSTFFLPQAPREVLP